MCFHFAKKEIFRTLIKVFVNGNLFHKNINLTATVIENKWFLMDELGAEIQTIEFGDVMLGSNPRKSIFLVNNSIFKINYQLFIIDGIFPEFNEKGSSGSNCRAHDDAERNGTAGDAPSAQNRPQRGQSGLVQARLPERGLQDAHHRGPAHLGEQLRHVRARDGREQGQRVQIHE